MSMPNAWPACLLKVVGGENVRCNHLAVRLRHCRCADDSRMGSASEHGDSGMGEQNAAAEGEAHSLGGAGNNDDDEGEPPPHLPPIRSPAPHHNRRKTFVQLATAINQGCNREQSPIGACTCSTCSQWTTHLWMPQIVPLLPCNCLGICAVPAACFSACCVVACAGVGEGDDNHMTDSRRDTNRVLRRGRRADSAGPRAASVAGEAALPAAQADTVRMMAGSHAHSLCGLGRAKHVMQESMDSSWLDCTIARKLLCENEAAAFPVPFLVTCT